jgi:hypothetical protein
LDITSFYRHPEELPDGAAVGESEVGIQLVERLEGEPSLGQTRVGNGQAGLVDDLVPVEEKIEVDRAGTEAGADAPDSPQLALDGEQALEELSRRQLRLQLDGAVQERRLLGVADRVGLAQPRDGQNRDAGLGGEQVDRPAERSLALAEIRPEAHEGDHAANFAAFPAEMRFNMTLK